MNQEKRQTRISGVGDSIGSLTALATFVVAASARAALIDSTTVTETAITSDINLSIDIDGDGIEDFVLFANSADNFTLTLSPATTGNGSMSLGAAESPNYVTALQPGDSVGNTTPPGTYNTDGCIWSATDSNLGGLGTTYVGVTFEITGTSHYGWLEFNLPNANVYDGGELRAAAYQSIPGADAPIPVPEIAAWQGVLAAVCLFALAKQTPRRWSNVLRSLVSFRKRVHAT